MVDFHSAKQELEEFGLSVSLSDNWLGGALTKRGYLFRGPSFATEYINGEWEVILGGHLAKWGRQLYFDDLADAVVFVKKVYQELPEEIAMGWKPIQTKSNSASHRVRPHHRAPHKEEDNHKD